MRKMRNHVAIETCAKCFRFVYSQIGQTLQNTFWDVLSTNYVFQFQRAKSFPKRNQTNIGNVIAYTHCGMNFVANVERTQISQIPVV